MKAVYMFLSAVIMAAVVAAGMAGLLCLTSAVTQHKHPKVATQKEYAANGVTNPQGNRQTLITNNRP